MIQNERQYRITRAQARKFEHALHEIEKRRAGQIHPVLHKARVDAIRSQLQDLRRELRDYERLRRGHPGSFAIGSIVELPTALIGARIRCGLTQKELASRLKIKEQQIQRYEATRYSGASLDRIQEVMLALGISVRKRIVLAPGRTAIRRHRTKSKVA